MVTSKGRHAGTAADGAAAVVRVASEAAAATVEVDLGVHQLAGVVLDHPRRRRRRPHRRRRRRSVEWRRTANDVPLFDLMICVIKSSKRR